MKIQPIENTKFGILKSTKKCVYAPNCWNTKTVGNYKDYEIRVFDNYIDGHFCSTMICLRKAGEWVKSKLRYFEDGKIKSLWSYANAKNDRLGL